MTAQTLFSHRVSIITGHYGTGKTELSVNLALALAAEGKRVMLADLDIVNPYFRSRERRPQLEAAGIQVISSSQACSDADVPALPAELLAILENRDIRGILDQLIFVLNANRPEVREAEHAIAYLRSIEAVTGLTCSGIVNNTHLCGETTPAEIRKGAALAEAVSRQTGIPILCHTAEVRFADAVSDLREPVFPITINMKKPWER